MQTAEGFSGFPASGLRFFADLKENNDRDWFNANKPTYLNDVVEPAKAFIIELGGMLQGINPGINFDTRTNGSGSMFRIYRDVRFSKDKSPYKTHCGMVFWLGQGKKSNSPAYYVGIGADGAGVYAGLWQFEKDRLAAYRDAVDDPAKADELDEILGALREKGYEIGGQTYKRVPRGFEADHPHADLLKHSAVHGAWPRMEIDIVTSPDFVPAVFEHCLNYHPMVDWIARNTTPKR